MEDAKWRKVSDVMACQKIAHAIQYQIRNDLSHPRERSTTSNEVPIPEAVNATVQRSVHEDSRIHTGAPIAIPRKLRKPRSLPTARYLSNNNKAFRTDVAFVPPITESSTPSTSILTNEGRYQQWLLEQSDDNRKISATAAVSDIFGNTNQSRSQNKNCFDPYLQQHPNQTAVDLIDFSQQMEYVGTNNYSNHPNMNGMAYDPYSDHRHIMEQNFNRKIPLFFDHIDNLQFHQHNFGGVLLNDGKLPAPVVHSLDVSGVSQWDGSVDFLEHAEYTDVNNDNTNVPPFDSHSNTDVVVTEMNFKTKQRDEQLLSHPNSYFHSKPPAQHFTNSDEAGLSLRHSSSRTTTTTATPPTTYATTNRDDSTGSEPSPMDSLLRAASDVSRDDPS